jgi:hypothetical protein
MDAGAFDGGPALPDFVDFAHGCHLFLQFGNTPEFALF